MTTVEHQWVVGMNMPGYMPDNEPSHLDTFEEAIGCMISDLETSAEHADTDTEEGAAEVAEIEEIILKLRSVEKPHEIGFTVGKWHYFLSRAID